MTRTQLLSPSWSEERILSPTNAATLSRTTPAGPNKSEATPTSSASSQMKKSKCGTGKGFLDLPAELRNYIYELILVSDVEIHMVRNKFEDNEWRARRIRLNQITAVSGTSLLRINRQIHAETKPILYGGNTFVVDGDEGLACFSRRVLPHIRRIRFDGLWSRRHELLLELGCEAQRLKCLECLAFTMDGESIMGPTRAEDLYTKGAKLLVSLLTAFMKARDLGVQDTVALVSFAAESDHSSEALLPSESMITTAADCTAEVRKLAGELLEQAGRRSKVDYDELSGSPWRTEDLGNGKAGAVLHEKLGDPRE
ncbi:hypothetical protein AC579_1792 [Pseudocercospora musae]|uniref:F-box domain-containing protein n=1 Tax=Pseudocercospora musae TaxID=113226 RepID=A0A139I0Q4_9PEZI|nr:hypothetical protein AC579_1792 [Pseudocercospora musae]